MKKDKKIGLVLEGGGVRGAYTAGALAWIQDNHLKFDYYNGISSGAGYLAFGLLNDDKHSPRNMATIYAADPHLVGIYPTTPVCNGFEAGNFETLTFFDDLDKNRGFGQRVVRTGVEPSKATTECLHF